MSSNYQNIHQDLINACCQGNTKAQFEIYKLYYKAMYNSCLRILNHTQEAEDVMQEAFLSAFDKINSYKGEVSFGAWLKRIVVNKALDYLKKNKIDSLPLDEKINQLSEEEDQNKTIEIENSVEDIKKAIEQLPSGYRIVLNLYLIEAYDHEEIGEILNISASTSRSQYNRAKKKLIQILQNSMNKPLKRRIK
ncbi:sigma-70 family RNA polymerase sigma factor [Ancylomarina euxinus]|uniref:Sigma-70 family RNA polymerase sigma factor n=1 Tax=Ancylomarina euxinus TaxID=2283627 RepID=A0A425Y1H3_9BACT|nr:sigma-70 family RNA polymerase sigma factor [Ancylomarina euxinus]MCZ4695182.1 sigma-70 family RNA polymerase sigma factor [Ancylomarina euxinus]MUP14884.1 sigma-70 family RNA polymerase sigma factor [Ancylomarina euxinus]RRG21779.1 sigma-70 family RNA polymerase sigma factor [Ancylomarina euxinus]